MKRLPLRIKATVQGRGEASGISTEAGEAVLIERTYPRWLLLKCPCGCGDEIPINLDRKAGKAWRFYRRGQESTLYPSVWRDTGCGSHFIISRNQIYLFGGDDDDEAFGWRNGIVERLIGPVEKQLALSKDYLSYVDVADALNEIPWDVLSACRRLVSEGRALEGARAQRGMFKISERLKLA